MWIFTAIADSLLFIKSLVNQNFDWFSLAIQTLTAFLVFILTKRLSKAAKIEHREAIKQKLAELRLGKEIYLVNIRRYFKDYPSNDEKLFTGYSHIKARFKTTRFDGVEFFDGLKDAYRKSDGSLTVDHSFKDSAQETIKVYEVGIVPYEWIEHVDLKGDEHGYKPLFFCRFRGRRYWKKSIKQHFPFGYPFKEVIYYQESKTFQVGDPADWKYNLVQESIT